MQSLSYFDIPLLVDGAAANNAPLVAPAATLAAITNATGARFGIALATGKQGRTIIRDASIHIRGAGTGASSAIFRAHLWWDTTAVGTGYWTPAGPANAALTDAQKGRLNNGLAVTGTNGFSHSEPFSGLQHADGVYLEMISPANLSDVDAWIRVMLAKG